MLTPAHGARLTIDRAALAANWRLLGAVAAGPRAAAVVKADGYGLGTERVVETLAKAGCATFFVAHLSEALRARRAAPDAEIYVLNGVPPGGIADMLQARVRPVLGSGEEVAAWRADAPEGAPAALHVDTGMSRLGLRPEEIGDLPAVFRPALVMSHFVSSEEPDDPLNARQIAAFQRVAALFPGAIPSLSNSSGVFLRRARAFAEGLVRPGYALYGGNPTPDAPNPMREVVRLDATILQIRHVAAGETVGYNAAWAARRPSLIATVSLGYADGFLRSGSSTSDSPGAAALIEGHRVPLVGRVSMDLITLDVTDLPAGLARRGATATFVGGGLALDEVARTLRTNGYEVLTRLGGRFERVVVGS